MKKRKLFSTVTALLLLVCFMPATAFAADWYIDDGDITISATDSGQTVSQGGGAAVADDTPKISQRNAGTTTGNTITIAADAGQTANVTIDGVNIDASGEGKAAISAEGEGNVHIELDGSSTVKSGYEHAGLEKSNSGDLTISDSSGTKGSLTAIAGDQGAGIGGANGKAGNDITITGGEITAIGRTGAGIGGGDDASGSNITITGGTVNASSTDGDTGKLSGAGIGGGGNGDGTNIKITGGRVTANGGTNGAGIGGGFDGSGKDISISGDATVIAMGGDSGAGIGGGDYGNAERIRIGENADVTANGGGFAAGIGGGHGGPTFGGADASDIEISGNATVKATGGEEAAGIGGGYLGTGSDIKISGGRVTAEGGKAGGAGIGGGFGGSAGDINISGGKVSAVGRGGAAGIGSGTRYDKPAGSVTVSGSAQVEASGGTGEDGFGNGAAIGNGGGRVFNRNENRWDGIDGSDTEPDVSGLYTDGWIRRNGGSREYGTIENPNGGADKPGTKPDDATAAAAAEDAASPLFRVTDKDGGDIGHDTATNGGVLTITADCDFAVLTGTLDGLAALARQGVKKLCFVTAGAESTFAIADILGKGASGDVFRLTHDGSSVSFTLGADGIDISDILE